MVAERREQVENQNLHVVEGSHAVSRGATGGRDNPKKMDCYTVCRCHVQIRVVRSNSKYVLGLAAVLNKLDYRRLPSVTTHFFPLNDGNDFTTPPIRATDQHLNRGTRR